MAAPSKKSFEMESSLRDMFGFDRGIHVAANVCVPAPIGCGGPANDFDDERCCKEFTISGLCQKCQDSIFGGRYER